MLSTTYETVPWRRRLADESFRRRDADATIVHRQFNYDIVMDMEIRSARVDDIPAVLPMVASIAALHEQWDPAKFGYKNHPEEMYRGWLSARATDPRSVFLVAARDETPVAFLIATVESEIPIYRLKEYGFIHDIWVEPQYRNEGVARQLVMLAIEKFRDLGMKQVRGDTAAANEAARGLMKSCGMRPSTTEMLIELP